MSATVLAHRPRSGNAARPRRLTHAQARTKTRTGWATADTWGTAGSAALVPIADLPRALQPATSRAVTAPLSAPCRVDILATPAAPPAPRLRLTRRGRLAVTLSAAALTMLLGLSVLPAVASGVATAFSPPATAMTTVVVQPGQSLWQIAQTAAPGGDTASVVARIADANGITRADQLRRGQRLEVPLS